MIGQKQSLSTLLGVTFEGGRMHLAQVRRVGDSFEVQKAFSAPLSASPATSDPQTLGLEIRQALLQQNIRENKCLVALPVQWMLSLATKIPDLPEEDIPDFLNLEAERNFAYDPESLFISSSRCRFPSGEQYANIAGIQREYIINLQNVLRVAKLKPISFTIGIAALQQMFIPAPGPVLILSVGQKELEVGITCGEGLYAMRSLENAEGGEAQSFDADAVGRELRVTLGQIPPDIRSRLVTARVFGSPDSAAKLRTDLAPRLRAMGIGAEPFNLSGDPTAAANAVASAAGYLLGKKSEFEFLPPKISAWKEFAGKNSSRKLAWAASMAAFLLVLVLAAFLVQGWQLSNLQNRWAAISPHVTELDEMQQQIKKFRPWFDNSFRGMTIFRKLTEAFPADGVVTAKTLEIRNQSQVTCSGVARDNQVLFKMLDQLRNTKEIADVKMDQIHGKSPLQFSFNFRWVQGGAGEHQ